VAMAGVLGIGANLLEWSPAERSEAAHLIEEYKAIRPTVQLGDLHRLSTQDGFVTAAEYLRDDEVVVLAWRPYTRFGLTSDRLRLEGLDPAARYRDAASGEEHLGATLLTLGVPVGLPPGDYASTCIRLNRI